MPRVLREALISWDHRTEIPLPSPLAQNNGAFTKTFDLSGNDAHLIDHNIDGRIILPVHPSSMYCHYCDDSSIVIVTLSVSARVLKLMMVQEAMGT